MNIEHFNQLPIVGIMRGITEEMLDPISEICKKSDIQAIEVTMNTENAPHLISSLQIKTGTSVTVGAGTVLNMDDLELALKAGADFIVMPGIQEEVISECVEMNIPVFPGALTPTEIQKAWDLGATMVKVFPSNVFGPKYFSDIKGPLNKTKLLACGGVTPTTIAEYFSNGADAVSFGTSIFNLDWMKDGQYEKVSTSMQELIDAYKKYKQ